jgi:hypothetical protein
MFNEISAKIEMLMNSNFKFEFFKFEPGVQLENTVLAELEQKKYLNLI